MVDLDVIAPPGGVDVKETTCAWARSQGSLLNMYTEVTGADFEQCMADVPAAIDNLGKLIAELDKGEAGRFNKVFWYAADQKWSRGMERERWIAEYGPTIQRAYGLDFDAGWAQDCRENRRAAAVRYYLYLRAGYELRWSA